MEQAEEFLRFAAECERIAQSSSDQDRAALLIIALAWRNCAEDGQWMSEAQQKKTGTGA